MTGRGVIVEFDFTALNGAEILFDTAKRFLAELDGIVLDVPSEARYLVGNDYQDGLQGLFDFVKTKKTAAKAARDLADIFNSKVTASVSTAVTQGFCNFVRTLADRGLKVVLATHADICSDVVHEAFDDLLGTNVVLHQEASTCYGSVKWESWRLACTRNGLRCASSHVVTGSGCGVKSALFVGMGALAVVNDHVSYHDFGGADAVVGSLDTAAAKKVLEIMHL